MPRFLKPDFYAPNLEDYTPENLAMYGIYPDTIGIDIDCTAVEHHGTELSQHTVEWFTMWQENDAQMRIGSNANLPRNIQLIEMLDGIIDPSDIFASKGLTLGIKGKPHPSLVQKVIEGSRVALYIGDQLPKDVLGTNLARIANRLEEIMDPNHDYEAPELYSGLVAKRGNVDHPGVAIQRIAIDNPARALYGIPLREDAVPPGVYRVR